MESKFLKGLLIACVMMTTVLLSSCGYERIDAGCEGIKVNLYGDDKNYKIFPDIGEEIRPDGVVFATRRLIPGLYPIQLSRRALQQYMDTDDGKIAKEENARVVSVEVIYAPKGKPTTYYTEINQTEETKPVKMDIPVFRQQ